jgi:hypothetical protein
LDESGRHPFDFDGIGGPVRKGIADLHRRAEISRRAHERLSNALARVDDNRSISWSKRHKNLLRGAYPPRAFPSGRYARSAGR